MEPMRSSQGCINKLLLLVAPNCNLFYTVAAAAAAVAVALEHISRVVEALLILQY